LTKWAQSTATEKADLRRGFSELCRGGAVNARQQENGGIPGLQPPDRRAERVLPKGVLAEGEELSSNPLSRYFNELRTTQTAVDVDWRILGLLRRSPLVHGRGPSSIRALSSTADAIILAHRDPAPETFPRTTRSSSSVRADTAVSFSRATSRTLVSSSNSVLTIARSRTKAKGRSQRAAPNPS
jgi:hypothetical protein